MNTRKKKNNKPISQLKDKELCNSGVGKILFAENGNLKDEVASLKKSLKQSQNELEKLRSTNHELEKKNNLMDYRLKTIFLPELIKFFASAVGVGFAINFFFDGKIYMGIIMVVSSVFIYGLMLYLYRK
ncbi:hypothetical protein HGA34_01410 [Candidatus Falkowbacteria bacterium]|nr:hypothetical protein [Candidatus Falkowbacteria bacterium]